MFRHAGLLAAMLAVARVAGAEEVLVPEGEPASLLDGARWAPASGFRAVSAAGAFVATGSDDGHLRLWDGTGHEVRRVDLQGPVRLVVATPDGSAVAAASGRAVKLFDAATGQLRSTFLLPGDAEVLAVSADGRRLVAGDEERVLSSDGSGAPAPLAGVDGPVRAAAFGPDGTLALGLPDHSIRLVPPTGEARTLSGLQADVTTFAFAPGVLAAGTERGSVTLFDFASGKASLTIDAHGQAITGLAFGAGGRVLVTSARDGSARLWDRVSGRELERLAGEGACCESVTVAEGGRVVVAAGAAQASRWDLATGEALLPLVGQPAAVSSVALATDGATAVTGSADGAVRVIDLATGREKRLLATLHGPVVVALAQAGGTAAAGDADGVVRVWELETGRELRRIREHQGAIAALAFSPDGTRLASASRDHTARLWTLSGGGRGTVVAEYPGEATGVAFSGDGKVLASSGAGAVRVYSLEKASETKRIAIDGAVTSVALSADGRRLLAGHADGTARLHDAVAGNELRRFKAAGGPVSAVAIAGEGRSDLVASRDGTVRFFDPTSGNESGRLDLGAAPTALALAKSGALLGVSREDGGFTLHDVADRTKVGEFHHGANGFVALTGGKLVRVDDGRLLLAQVDEGGGLKPVAPTILGATPKITAEVGAVVPASADRPGKITVKLKVEANPATWVSLKAPQLPAGLSVLLPPRLVRIEKGAEATLEVGFALLPGAALAKDQTLALQVTSVDGDGPALAVPVRVRGANVELLQVILDGARSAPVAKAEIVNSGDAPTGALLLTPKFFVAGAAAGSAPVQQLPDLGPGEHQVLGFALPASIVGSDVELELTAASSGLAATSWTAKLPLQRRFNWMLVVGLLLGAIALAVLVWFVRISRHPIVLQVARAPEELRRYDLAQLELVHGALLRARRLDSALAAARVPEARWSRARSATSSPKHAANAFCEALGAKAGEQLANQPAWVLELPPLSLRFPQKTAIAVITGQTLEPGAASALAGDIHASGQGPTVAIALDLTQSQQARAVLQSVPRMSFVVLSKDEYRDLLFADDPASHLQRAIAAQRPLSELSPYMTSGGVEDESLFFGRERELRQIADRTLHNFIVVAPRQMGKSSLLKAIQRRLATRPDVEVHHITLFEDDIQARVGRALGVARPETPEQFLDVAAGTRRKPRVWLVDEADGFIVKDSKNKYPIAQAMRTLSEEGRAYFVLAGFWHLYAAAFLNPNNPLRNFGELIRLEPLERGPARDLATRPMAALGLSWESPEILERVLDETACRAHLVACVAKGILDNLGASDKVIGRELVETALYNNPALADEFKHWRRDVLGRAVLRAALAGRPANRGELRTRLLEAGVNPPTETFAATLDKLELGYLLVPDQDGLLDCPVPLLKRFIEQEEDVASGLRRDAEDFKLASGS